MPNVMAALPNIGVQRRKVWLTPTTRVPCSNAKPVEICWGAQTNEPISAASGPKFTIF